MHLRREIQENLIDTRFLHLLHVRRQKLLDRRQNLPALQPVWIQTDLPRSNLPKSLVSIAIAPFNIALFPRRNVLADQLRTLFFRFGNRDVSVQPKRSSRIVDRYEALPLLHGEGFGGVEAEADGFALRVEGVKVDVGDYAERTCWRSLREGGEVFVCVFAASWQACCW